MKRAVLLVFSLLLVSACGQKLEGTTYESSRPVLGITSFKFERGGKVYVSVMGQETELKYEVDGNKVKIISPQGNQILPLLEDGSTIEGGMAFGTLRLKQKFSQKVEGTYSVEVKGEQVSLTFEPGGKFHLSSSDDKGQKKYGKYEVTGTKIKIIGPGGKADFLTLHEDGSLEGSDGTRLTKK